MLYKCILISFCQGSNSRRRSISHLNFIDICFIGVTNRHTTVSFSNYFWSCWFNFKCYCFFNLIWCIDCYIFVTSISINIYIIFIWLSIREFYYCIVCDCTWCIKYCFICDFSIIFTPFKVHTTWIVNITSICIRRYYCFYIIMWILRLSLFSRDK